MENYFLNPELTSHKQYEALRAYYVDKLSGKKVAEKFGYTYRGFTSLLEDFRKKIKHTPNEDPFFIVRKKGRKEGMDKNDAESIIIELRKKYYSIPDIKVFLDAKEIKMSEKNIFKISKQNGFAKLPRRDKKEKINLKPSKEQAPISTMLEFDMDETFSTNTAGLLCFMPYIHKYGIDKIIKNSDYPETKSIDRLSSILSFLALKLSNIRRYSCDDIWCNDRGSGLFAKLNVLPKSAWLSSYSSRITKNMNISFLKELHQIWISNELLSDTSNLDFTSIPYWGESEHLENNWSGKRRQSLASMLAILAHDPDTGIIDYGDTDILHKNQNATILEFLDFYKTGNGKSNLKYIVFDSKFTNYENLSQLNDKQIKFITIRRRGKKIVEGINSLPQDEWKRVRVKCAGNKSRWLKVNDSEVKLKGYKGKVRQIAITGHGKIKPALIITNDFTIKKKMLLENIVVDGW